MRIKLTEENLKNLLTGKVVKVESVEIALEDMGYDRIIQAILKKLK